MASELIVNEPLIAKIASLIVAGGNISQTAREVGLNREQVRRVMALPEFKARMKELADATLLTAKEQLRAEIGKLSKEVLRVIQANLEKDNLEAVKVALKIMGFDQVEQQTGDTNIQVVLPGAPASKPTIEVPAGTQE